MEALTLLAVGIEIKLKLNLFRDTQPWSNWVRKDV